MDTTSSVHTVPARRQTDLIRQTPSRNLHLGVRLAKTLGLELNTFVSFNFTLTRCDPKYADRAFARLREMFGKWATRPGGGLEVLKVPPTFVWVIENPNERLNAHWMVHVPEERQAEFEAILPKWFERSVGEVYSEKAIDIRPAKNPEGLKSYFLKGLHPSVAKIFRIRHEYQGWVYGRRIGHSRNLGPVQVKKWRDLGLFPPAQRWQS